MQTLNLKKPLDCAGPQSRVVYIKFTPSGSNAPTVAECHGCSATVSRSSAGVYVVSLGVNGVKAMTVVGCNVLSSGVTNNKLQWSESVANKTITITHTTNPTTTTVAVPRMADVSSAQTVYAMAPVAGTISKIYSVLGGAISGAVSLVQGKIGGTNITTGGVLTVTHTSSATGDIDVATPSAGNTVTLGQAVTFVSDGGSTDTATLDIWFNIDHVGVASDVAGQISLAVLCREAS